MAEVHDLVFRLGRHAALQHATTDHERRLIDMAALVLSEESNELGITYAGFCMTSLPHRDTPGPWERKNGRASLLIEPGKIYQRGQWVECGIPYGSRARLIMLYIQTEAISRKSRMITLGRSMRDWMSRMGISIGGKSYQDVREQANRLSACRLSFGWSTTDGQEGFTHENIIKGLLLVPETRAGAAASSAQGALWEDTAEITETFYNALKAHPVPVWEPAIKAIRNNSAAIDAYIWLCYRLHALSKPVLISWTAMKQQFGSEYKELRQFKYKFTRVLQEATAVYPDAEIEITPLGVLLKPSRPAVPERRIISVRFSAHRD